MTIIIIRPSCVFINTDNERERGGGETLIAINSIFHNDARLTKMSDVRLITFIFPSSTRMY